MAQEYPETIMIEISSRCNYVCKGCPSHSLPRGKGDIDPGLFAQVMDEISGRVDRALFWNFGEPFMHPHLPEIIAYAGDKSIRKEISTNGALLHTYKDLSFLSGLDKIMVSINGLSERTYQQHQQGRLSVVEKGLPALIDALQEARTIVALQIVAHRGNLHELPNVEAYARKFGFDELIIKSFNVMDGLESTRNRFVPTGTKYARRPGPRSTACQKGLVINWNGDVNLCCYDYKGSYVLGNIAKSSIATIWEETKEVRASLLQRRLPFCTDCTDSRFVEQRELKY